MNMRQFVIVLSVASVLVGLALGIAIRIGNENAKEQRVTEKMLDAIQDTLVSRYGTRPTAMDIDVSKGVGYVQHDGMQYSVRIEKVGDKYAWYLE